MKPVVLLLDSYDSFTYNLKDYLEQSGASVVVYKNDEVSLDELSAKSFDGIVLSPGPKTPEKSGIVMDVLKHYEEKLPILGVCLGHQAIGHFYGMELEKLEHPMHGKVSILHHNDHPLFHQTAPHFEVCRYHSLTLKPSDHPDLDIIGWSEDQTVMALAHKLLPIWGVQFHPEAILTQYGTTLIDNWLNLVKLDAA